ncbi:MAG: right-handed parallel beta-helix repeat-containing protein, partial [Gammaproteobacteria bacterium]|nr:right-handed parallel beta-helix repeat-containing protein [Gammaproteobacteria bacterium]
MSTANAATFTVTKTADSNDGNCDADCSLREAVIAANNNFPVADTITLPAGVYTLTLGPSGDNVAATGDLDVLDSLTINGAGARTTIIDGNANYRIIDFPANVGTLTLSDLTLRNGNVPTQAGGAIRNLDNPVFLTDVSLIGNTAEDGGAVHVSSGDGSLTANRVTMSGNSANKKGGAVYGTGGGIRINITNSTFNGNSAVEQGGAFEVDHLALLNTTIAGNTAPASKGGGVWESSGQEFSATNTIIANNTGGDCATAIDSGSNNIDSDNSCGFVTTADPKLGPLANNGGPTDTMALLSESPAIETGTNTGCPATDQRQIVRPDGFLCDIGAYEGDVPLVTGRVFEDADFSGTASDYDGGTDDVALANVDVELYNNTDMYIGSTTTDGSGNFVFAVNIYGTYKVRARTATIGDSNTPPNGTFNGACGVTDPASGPGCAVAEQTWGNGVAAYGGQSATVDDTTTNDNAGPGDTWVSVTVSGADVSNVNLGFAYNLVVNTLDGGQGSLRQFLRNANEIDNKNGTTASSSEFRIPASDPGFAAGVAVIAPSTALPSIADAGTTIDGTTQTSNWGDTNPGFLGRGGTVGVDAVPLAQVAAPEIEIRAGGVIANGLLVQEDDAVIRGLAVLGFGAADGDAGILLDGNRLDPVIENNVLGATATSFTDPGAALRNYTNIDFQGADRTVVRNNLIGFSRRAGVWLNANSDANDIEGNEIRDSGLETTDGDGIAIASGSDRNTITGNFITGSSTQGFVVTASSDNDFINNTVTGNGVGSPTGLTQSAGITIRSTATKTLLDRNLVLANHGAGIQVNNNIATTTRLTQNSFADNGTIVARNGAPPTGQIGIDLNGPGDDANFGTSPFYTINDAGDGDSGGNTLLNFPVLDTATISGGNLTLTGWSPLGATIELFIADGDASGFGEGETWVGTFVEGVADADATASQYGPGLINGLNQGTDTTNRFSFTVPTPAGVVDGVKLTASGTVGQDTSEFSGVVTAVAVYDISGTIFEDIAGNVLNGAEAIGDAANPVVTGVDVYLYRDDGGTLGSPDATDTIQNGGAPMVTDGSGVFTFPNITDGTYWAVVDSRTVSPSAGVHPSYLATTPWSEQTFGPDNGWCADGIGGTTERVGAGACFGGVDGATDDDASALVSSEHIARVVVSGGAVSNVDFGFSYNVVTNVEPAGNVSLTASTYQGSIDQFVRNANSINGANTMRFVPAVPTNAAGGGGTWWRVDYTGSVIGETITNTHDADTSIDGTAFDLADGVTVRNTNPANLGANALGGLTAGVDSVALPQVARPELEVMRSDSAVGVAFYFYSNSSTGQVPNNYAVRDVATWGFVGGVGMTGIAGMRPTGVVVERNVIGSPPDGFSDPAIAGTLRGVALLSTDSATVRDNLIGFVDTNGVQASAVTATTITGNEIRDTGQVDNVADGINYGGTSNSGTITANLIVDSGGMGIDGTATGNLVENNTVTGSGQLGVQTGGIRQTGSTNTIRRNIVTGSAGPGVIVPDTVNAIDVTENQFGANGSIAIDVVEAGGDTATGDGIMLNDGALDAADGNDGLDFPIIDGASIVGGNVTVIGFARADVEIEFYEAFGAANDNNASGNPHGEGIVYLFTATEGVADADATTGTSYTDPGYGSDPDVNRFSFTVPAPAGLAIGDTISAIAHLASEGTSEFGPNVTVTGSSTISGTIFVDEAGDGLADGPIGPAPNAFEAGVRIELYRAGADGDADGVDDTYITFTTSSAVDGTYSFTGLIPGTYYVTVDSHGVDDGPYNGGYSALDTWAEQTYGPVGAASFDGSTWSYAATAGSFYGGAEWDVSDDHIPANSLPTAEHIARVDTTGGDATNTDFGFSFNVVTSTRGASAAQDPGAGGGQRTVQGSLRQFITNANAQTGANAMRFVPAAPTNASFGGNNWRRVSVTAQLPNIEDAATTVDGSAYDPADGITPLNTNTAAIGTGAAVGVSGLFTTPLLDPELEIHGGGVVAGALYAEATADNTEIRNLAINAFPTIGISAIGILPDALDSVVIENNVIGTSPASFTDDPSLYVGSAVAARDLSNSTIRNNLVGWVGRGFQISFDTVDTLIETNEIRGADAWGVYLNGVASTGQQAERITLQGNLIEGGAGGLPGLETQHALGDLTINQNTIRLNSVGVRLYGANNTVTGNIISDNSGDALTLVGNGIPSVLANAANLISQNQFGNNGAQAIDLTETGSNGDGVTINDDGDPDLG